MDRPDKMGLSAVLRITPKPPLAERAPTPGWRVAHIGFEGDACEIGGHAVWKTEWRRVDLPGVRLAHPAYPNQLHDFLIYEIGDASAPVCFASVELSNGVFGFYIRE